MIGLCLAVSGALCALMFAQIIHISLTACFYPMLFCLAYYSVFGVYALIKEQFVGRRKKIS